MNRSVAAVVVTYNRSRLLQECLASLLGQSHPLDKVVIVDNASSDDTAAALKSNGYLDHPKIVYARLSTNSGGAGGFYTGMKMAFELGYEWIWIMDDDAEPYPDALERMLPGMQSNQAGAVANLTIGTDGLPQREHRGWLRLNSTEWRVHNSLEGKPLADRMEISFASFVGVALHRSVIERIGLPKPELFIKGDDLEYCVRLAAIGPLLLMPDSKIAHKDGQGSHYEIRRRFGFESRRLPMDKLWLNYFGLRNLIWIRRQHCGKATALGFSLRQFVRLAVGIVMFDSHRFIRLRFYWNAVLDAWQDVFDNDKPRRLTRIAAPLPRA